MERYLMIIITVSICVGIYNVIAPNYNGLEKYSKMIGMLVVLCVIISPLKELMDAFDDEGLQSIKDSIINSDNEEEIGYDELFNDYLSSFSLDEYKKEIENILLEKFAISKDECDISVFTEMQNGKLTVSNIQILLSGKSIFKNPYSIEEYFEKLLECGCQVLIK